MTLAGTTDNPSEVTLSPTPKNSDVDFILQVAVVVLRTSRNEKTRNRFQEVRSYLSKNAPIRRSDVTSAWSGLRPLVRDPNKKDTKSLARNHIIEVSKSGLITIAGGKWTTYRHMAEETVDTCIKANRLRATNDCVTAGLFLEGGHDYNPLLYIQLIQKHGLDEDVAEHLAHTYGDRAVAVTTLSNATGKRLHQKFPFLDVEVKTAGLWVRCWCHLRYFCDSF
ncbi:hypothetical protein OESDEN_16967 [Oesophagostomum dentatum]|uniref:glycerol-3-phosphate dehydrogenase n=1 Tax=Oesophagostomum dentatum TaxID=61180 RepID=A0A0B1SHG5_OESDE|nr:hypothetical protein OESDEN_16967 [Oesophagostomum dentatum]